MATVELKKLVKHYPNSSKATVDKIDLFIRDQEFVVLVGPSGCGKSTVLRMIAGLEDVTFGDVFIDGRRVNELAPKDRNVAMVFQNYALFPHLTVFENLAFGMKVRNVPHKEQVQAISEAAKVLGLEDFLERKPSQLSGGQRQRVAIGRAIVRKPYLFLFDEPLSNLDAKLRGQMRSEIIRLHRHLKTTMVYVTHDQIEAMTMADRIVVFEGGNIQQVGTPSEIYEHPANVFVAGFIGSPTMNFFKGRIEKDVDKALFVSELQSGLKLDISKLKENRLFKDGLNITLGIRPENFYFSNFAPKNINASRILDGTVELVEYFGLQSSLTIRIGKDVFVVLTKETTLRPNDKIQVVCDLDRLHLFEDQKVIPDTL